MGCCVSKSQELFIDVPRSVSTTDEWALRQKSFLDSCKLLPYTAACPASYPYQCLTRVVLGDGHLFAALWEGKGGSQAARHCVSVCYDLVVEGIKSGADPSAAMQKACQQMDEAYFASELTDLVKASVGATGTMMWLDTKTNRCHVTRLGKAVPFATASKGSFNRASVEVKDLVPFSNNARARPGSCAPSSSSTPQQQDQQWDPATSGVTHAIGMGCGKRENLRKVWQQQQQHSSGADNQARKAKQQRMPKVSNECEVYVSQLSTADENLIIAAEGLCQISPPREIATLLQHFNAGSLNDTKRALCAIQEQLLQLKQQQEAGAAAQARPQGRDGKSAGAKGAKQKAGDSNVADAQPDPLAELSSPTNVASIVVHQALGKALARFNQAISRDQQQQQLKQMAEPHAQQGRKPGAAYQVADGAGELSYDELKCLPLHVDVAAFTSAQTPASEVRLPDSYPLGGLSKADVHGDMGIVVVALNWPRPADALRGAAAPVTPLRPGPRALSRRPGAEWRWMLLRLHVKALQAYRRDLRKAWWRLVDEVQAAAETAARQAEVHAWKTKGAAVKVNLSGAIVDPETPVNFLRAHHTTSSGPSRQPHRQPGEAASPASRHSSSSHAATTAPVPAASLNSNAGAAPYSISNSSSGGGGGICTAVTAGPQAGSSSLPDVAVRSQRSLGGTRTGVVAAAVAAINSQSPAGSPRSGTASHRSSISSSYKASAIGHSKQGELSVSAVQADCPAYALQDTAQDLDSPTKALDSPNRFGPAGAWATPTGPKVRGVSGGAADAAAAAAWSPASGATPGKAMPSAGSHGMVSSGAYTHKSSLSLRSSGRAVGAKSFSPAAGTPDASSAGTGRLSTASGAYVTGAGVTGRRPTSGSGAGGGLRGGSNTHASAKKDYDLRGAARKPAARW